MSKQSSAYIYEIGGDVKGIFGDVIGGVVNQYIIAQKSQAEIHSQKLKKGSPYLGLNKFEPEDKDKFFGRELWINKLSGHLEQNNLLLLLGASGSGKSSLVQAGIIPHLSDEWGASKLVKLIFVPYNNPFESLYNGLPNNYKNRAAKIINQKNNDVLIGLIKELKENSQKWLIFIDQFEEIFVITPKLERDKFIASLVSLIKQQDSSVKLIIAMRSDFLDNLKEYGYFTNEVESQIRLIRDMTESELRLAIAEPAARNGVTFEKGLVEQILHDFYQQAGSLPLLEYTLDLLWREDKPSENNRVLNIATYQAIGGVSGALQKQANYIYKAKLNDEEKKAAEKIFIELIDLAVKKPVSRRVEESQFTNEPIIKSALNKLIESRLLVSGRNESNTVEVAHEELLRSWGFIQNLMREQEEIIILRSRLIGDANQWYELRKKEDEEKAQDELWSGSKLERVLELIDEKAFGSLDEKSEQFIQASVERRDRQKIAEEKQRKLELEAARILTRIAIFVSVIISGFTIFAGYQWRQAEIGQIRALRTSSEALLESNPLEALKESLRAGKKLKQRLLQIFTLDVQLQNQVRATLHKAVYRVNERKRLAVPKSMLLNAIFSPDGSRLVTTGNDGRVRLWDLSGEQLAEFTGHTHRVYGVSFSPNGDRIATGGDDNTVRLWDLQGKEIPQCEGHIDGVRSVTFSPDGRFIASAAKDKTARLWDLKCKQLAKFTGHRERLTSVSFRSDGKQLATTSADGTTRLWNLKAKQLREFRGHGSGDVWVNAVSFSPNDDQIATAGQYGNVCFWNLDGDEKDNESTNEKDNRKCDDEIQAHKGWVTSLSFSPSGRFLATSGQDGTARVWNLESGEKKESGKKRFPKFAELAGHIGLVSMVDFNPDNSTHLVVTVGQDGTVRLWDIEGQQFVTFTGHSGWVDSVSFNRKGNLLATGSQGSVSLWNWNLKGKGKKIKDFLAHQGSSVAIVSFSPDGQHLATAGDDGIARLWNLKGKKIKEFKGHKGKISNISFNRNGTLLATAGEEDRTARVWSLEGTQIEGTQITEFNEHEREVWSAVFIPNTQRLVTSANDGIVRLWDFKAKELLKSFQSGDLGEGDYVSISPDGSLMATGGYHGIIQLWHLSGEEVKPMAVCGENLLYQVRDMDFSLNGQQLATAHSDGTARVWNLSGQSCQQLAEFKHGSWLESVRLSPDGSLLATGSSDDNAKLWRIESFNELMKRGCDWVRDYLENNPNVEASNKHLCDGIGSQK